MDVQRTIQRPVSVSGLGLFSGEPVNVHFRPAPANHGVVFVRTDLRQAQIPALVRHVLKRARRTALKAGDAVIETTEHVLSAVAGLGIDNLVIEIDKQELPGFDGSAKPFVDALVEAGIQDLDSPRKYLVVTEPVMVQQDDAILAALPGDGPMNVVYDMHYGNHPVIGRQMAVFDFATGNFAADIAPCRTFVLEAEAKALRAAGLGRHLSESDIVVIDNTGPMGGNAFRFPNECARHKLLDLIGDLSLLGAPIRGKIVAFKSGHWLNQAMVRKLDKQLRQQTHKDLMLRPEALLDIRTILRILPHRYPMLLIDRVLELDGDRRVLGIKNVTFNEPFFSGHYPSAPIMPGVLIVEAMAQLSGILVGQKLENRGKLAVLLSMDRVKLRKPVTPGDQLILEAEAARFRSRIAHCRCRAYVGQELVAEAEVKFMLVDAPQD